MIGKGEPWISPDSPFAGAASEHGGHGWRQKLRLTVIRRVFKARLNAERANADPAYGLTPFKVNKSAFADYTIPEGRVTSTGDLVFLAVLVEWER
jgi:hypothetical protein